MSDKDLSITSIEDAKTKVSDIQVVGNGNAFKLLSKAWSEKQGWMKSSKAMEIPFVGAVVQVTTQQKNLDGTYSVAEAVTFIDGVKIVDDVNGGSKLVPYTATEMATYGSQLQNEMLKFQADERNQLVQASNILESVKVRNINS